MAQAGRGPQVAGGPQALGRGGDVQCDRSFARFTISRTTKWSTSFATASRSCGFWGSVSRTRCPTPRRCGFYREQLSRAGVIEALFDAFDGHLKQQGYLAMGGQIIDASIVPVPKQRNSRDENARIKDGEMPEGWENQPAKRSQKDTDARWTKKHGKSHYGYKNHVNVDRRHKLVRRYQVTDAAVHYSQVVDDILDPDNTARRCGRTVPIGRRRSRRGWLRRA